MIDGVQPRAADISIAPRATEPHLVLQRGRSTDQGTPGVLLRPDGSRLAYTLELPWRENRRCRSSIPPGLPPAGRYPVRLVSGSPKFGDVYHVEAVPGRTSILMHSGNVAGDVELGFASHVLGCILLGRYFGTLSGPKGPQLAVLVSRPAVAALLREMAGKPFTLEIRPWTSGS
jgi:hypothetical protein